MTDPVRDILPARSGETDQERRMRETINRLAGQMIGALDAAIALRTAPGAAAPWECVADLSGEARRVHSSGTTASGAAD